MMAVHSFAIRDLVYARHRMRADFGVVPRALRSETFAFYTSCSACRVLCLAASLPLSHPPRPSYHKNDIVSFSFFFFVNSCFYSLFLSFGRHLSSFVFFPRDFEVCYEGYRYEDRRRRRTISHIFQSFVGQFYITNFSLRESSRMCEYIQIFSSTSHQVTWILKSQ